MFRNYTTGTNEAEAVGQGYPNGSPSDRWFILMGFAGFNSPANNRNGYATKEAAEKACLRYQNKKARP